MSYTSHRSLFARPVGLLFALALTLAPILGLAPAPEAHAASGGCVTNAGTVTCTFNYTGAAETWTVPAGVTSATFDLYGAGAIYAGYGGKGGRVRATLDVAPGATYQILVGAGNGFNGGGHGGHSNSGEPGGSPGGGASDVRLSPYTLAERLLVAGGGGGTRGNRGLGGDGGYPAGTSGGGGAGGSQTAGGGGASGAGAGSLGQGGAGEDASGYDSYGGGGGGGGYYGGGGGGACEDLGDNCRLNGGGGGSSYATPAATNVSFETGVRSDSAGQVIISYDLESVPPTASPTQSPAATNGWNNTDVMVSWNWADNDGSGIDPSNCTQTSSSSGEGEQTLSASCADLAGNQGSATYTVKVDKTAPTLNPVVSPNPVQQGGSATVTANASDSLSGIASQSCGALDTTSAGTKTVTCTATDNAGNTTSASVTYQVAYHWSGFFQPIDNLPAVNRVKAGRAIPVTFSLGGDQGLNIFANGYPKAQPVACDSGAPTNEVEQTVTAGASGLSYDAASDTYTYVWKTDKSWAGTCRQLVVRLMDGSEQIASFQFR